MLTDAERDALSPEEQAEYDTAIAIENIAGRRHVVAEFLKTVLESLARLRLQAKAKCVWTFDGTDGQEHYDTTCGHAYSFYYNRRENEFKFCPYCRGQIEDGNG